MEKIRLIMFLGLTTFFFYGCSDSGQKVQSAQDDVEEANKDLEVAKTNYLEDVAEYRKQTAVMIAQNEKSIAEFNERIKNEKADEKYKYEAKIKELESRNTDMKKRMDDYKVESKEKWDMFKAEFSNDMDELGLAFKNLFTSENEKK
ncbi:MAG: peptidase M23 [Flavobacteriales bacterium]